MILHAVQDFGICLGVLISYSFIVIRVMESLKDVQIGQRMMTISTVGVPNTIKMLATHKLQSTLAVR